jgi:hypothetical protein
MRGKEGKKRGRGDYRGVGVLIDYYGELIIINQVT